MTTRSDMLAAGPRLLELLSAAEVAQRLRVSTGKRCSVEKVARLAAAGELTRVDLGAFARYTPESVAAYEQRQDAARNAKTAPRCHRGEQGAWQMNRATT